MNEHDEREAGRLEAHVVSITDHRGIAAIGWLTDHGARPSLISTGPDGTGIVFDQGPGTPVHIALPGDTLIRNPNGIITVT